MALRWKPRTVLRWLIAIFAISYATWLTIGFSSASEGRQADWLPLECVLVAGFFVSHRLRICQLSRILIVMISSCALTVLFIAVPLGLLLAPLTIAIMMWSYTESWFLDDDVVVAVA